jgi:hypothetical protein
MRKAESRSQEFRETEEKYDQIQPRQDARNSNCIALMVETLSPPDVAAPIK